MKNSTGSVGSPNCPEIYVLDFREAKNSLSLGRPSPVTLEIVKIGQVTLLGIAFAHISTSEVSEIRFTCFPACFDSRILVNVYIVSS